jgi:branched-chain amino acid transport system substrate-binding protein
MHDIRRLGLRLGLLVATTSGCALGESFSQCQTDADCLPLTKPGGSKLYCTTDNLCSVGTPAAKLCTDVYPQNPPANPIVVGVLTNIMGGSDALPVLAFKQAIDEINASRTSTGDRLISLNLCEISATPDDPLKSMKILTRERGAVAVLGPSSSSYVQQIAIEVTASGVPIMSQSSTSPLISGLPGQGLFYRVAPSDTLQGTALVTLFNQQKMTTNKFDMLTLDDSYGNGLQQAFLAAMTRTPGLSVSYTEMSGSASFLAMQAAALQTSANKIIADSPAPDLVVAITNNSTAQVVQDLVNFDSTKPLIMADGAKNQMLLALVTGASASMLANLKRIQGTAPTVDQKNVTGTGAYSNLKTTYMQKWSQDLTQNNYIAYAYDAAYAIGLAIGAAGNDVTAASVSAMLQRLNGQTGNITVGPTAYLVSKNKLAAGGGLTLQGATGNIRFTPHGDRDSGLYEVWSIDTVNNKYTSLQLP